MKKHRKTLRLAVPLVAMLSLVACGSDDETSSELPPVEEPTEDVTDDSVAQPVEEPVEEPVGDADMILIGSGNQGGTVVDPQPYVIDSIAIMESFPEQLAVNFTAGDPNCTAADATASITGDVVLVQLTVGITEDALTRSCLAGNDFEHTVVIALDEPLDGREVVGAQLR